MTGSEAWSIIAPILAAHMERIPHRGTLNCLDEAYVVACGALIQYDEARKKEKGDGNG